MDKTYIQLAVEAAGGLSELARRIIDPDTGKPITRQSVWRWVEQNQVPANRCRAVEAAVSGAVTAEQLRPDIFGHPSDDRAA